MPEAEGGNREGAVEKEARNQGEGLRRARKAHLLHPYLSAHAHTAHAVHTRAQGRMYACTCPHAHKRAEHTHMHTCAHTRATCSTCTQTRTQEYTPLTPSLPTPCRARPQSVPSAV